MSKPEVTIITPTTGSRSLYRLVTSLKQQNVPYRHIILWDDKREDDFLFPDPKTMAVKNPFDLEDENTNCVVVKGSFVKGKAFGSSLRAVGLMMADTTYVTFADTDVWYDPCHLEKLMQAVQGKYCAHSIRKVWSPNLRLIGEDRFESIGADCKLGYNLLDNNTIIFHRRLGTSAACLYRETEDYNDDRLMYGFLAKHGGEIGKTNEATVNQICPTRLAGFFAQNCTRVPNTGKKATDIYKDFENLV